MTTDGKKQVEYLVVDTTAFIQNASLHVAEEVSDPSELNKRFSDEEMDYNSQLPETSGIQQQKNGNREDVDIGTEIYQEEYKTGRVSKGRIKWNPYQKKIVLERFKNHIKKKMAPKKDECLKLISDYPELHINDWEVADNIITCKEVVEEITNKRQLRRLIVLPYDLIVKEVFPENIKVVTDFSKKTGDYPSLSATDIKVMALTYQLEKEKVGVEHLRTEPILQRPMVNTENSVQEINPDITGFYLPGQEKSQKEEECFDIIEKESVNKKEGDQGTSNITNFGDHIEENLISKKEYKDGDTDISYEKFRSMFQALNCNENDLAFQSNEDGFKPEENLLVSVETESSSNDDISDEDDDENAGWITPSNVKQAKKQVNSQLMEEKQVVVACMTTDFAMQNVLRQMNLNVSALDGRLIKQLRTYILRCYACFKTTSIMTKKFCPKCGNDTLKKVAVSVDENGKMQIHINAKKPLTGRGKKFSLPRIKGGKHPNNPILVADQPIPDNRPSRLARTTNNPLDDDYIAEFSPFIMRDVNSKSAQLGIRPGTEFKQWMRKNPNESRRRRK